MQGDYERRLYKQTIEKLKRELAHALATINRLEGRSEENASISYADLGSTDSMRTVQQAITRPSGAR